MPGSIASYPYGVPQSTTFWRQYEYDPLSRLLTANGVQDEVRWTPGSGGMDPQNPWAWWAREPEAVEEYNESFSYDGNSNLLSLTHANTVSFTRAFSIDSGSNRLEEMDIASTTHSYLYDPVGNMVKENTNRQMTWDFADRMHTYRTQVDEQQASVYAHYLYDAGGERVMKVVSKSSSDVVTIYIDGVYEHRELRTSGDDDINDEIHIMDGAERDARLRVDDDSSPEVIYVLSDHLGSSTVTLEDDGTFYSREEYTPYGESAFGSYEKKRYRFTAKEKDEESGLHYHGARYYAPWTARWNAPDPAGLRDGPNLYAYARSNPIRFGDSTGLEADQTSLTSYASGFVSGAKAKIEQKVEETVQTARAVVATVERAPELVKQEAARIGRAAQARPGESLIDTASRAAQQIATPYAHAAGAAVAEGVKGIADLADEVGTNTAIGVKAAARGDLETVGQAGGRNAVALGGLALGGVAAKAIDKVLPDTNGRGPSTHSRSGAVNLDTGTATALVEESGAIRTQLTEAIAGREMLMTDLVEHEFLYGAWRFGSDAEVSATLRLLDEVTVIATSPSARVMALKESNAIKHSDKLVFGTGDRLGVPTFTSDARFVRAAADPGFQPNPVDLWTYVHSTHSFSGFGK